MTNSRFAFIPVALIAAFVLAIAGCGGDDGGTTTDNGAEGATQTQSKTAEEGADDNAEGKEVFTSAGCAGCHTLAAAGSDGQTGPNLDDLKPSQATVETKVENGGGGMPAFKDQLSPEEIQAVAAYVSSSAGQ